MANKTFRRVLSVIMCAAMLVSVFAVSFNVSAADETVYDWDFTDAANGANYVSEMTAISEFINNGSAANFTYDVGGYCSIGTGIWYVGAAFNTPEGYAPSKLTVTSQNDLRETGQLQYVSAGPVIGKVVYGTGEEAKTQFVQVTVMSKTYGAMLHITDTNWGLGSGVKSNVNLNLKNVETGEYVGNSYEKAFGFKIANENYNYLTYKYDVSVSENNDVIVVPTITYTDPDTSAVYTTEAAPITINLASLQAANSDVLEFTPSFGVARYGEFMQDQRAVKLYSVKAVYTKAGAAHEHTAAADRKDVKEATCTEPGYTGDVVCAECGEVMEKGTVIPALGHTPDGEGVVTEPTCTEAGYTTFHCSVCDKDYTEAGAEALGHNYEWVVTRPATETETGLKEHKCTRCSDVDETKEIPVLEPEYNPEVKIASASVIVDDGINLKIDISYQDIDEESLKLTVDGKEYTLTELTDYRSVIISKYAHQMTDKFTVTLTATGKDGKEYSDVLADYSIAKNLETIFEKSNEETKTLIAKLANYGAAAQKYNAAANGTEAGELANAFLNGEYATDAAAFEAMIDCERAGSFAVEGSEHFADAKCGLTIALQSKVSMIVKVADAKLNEGETIWVGTSEADAVEFNIDSDIFTATLGAFAPNKYKDTVELKLFVKDAEGNVIETSGSVTYSVGAYINRMCGKNTTSAELVELLNAMSEYYTAAVEYSAVMA